VTPPWRHGRHPAPANRRPVQRAAFSKQTMRQAPSGGGGDLPRAVVQPCPRMSRGAGSHIKKRRAAQRHPAFFETAALQAAVFSV